MKRIINCLLSIIIFSCVTARAGWEPYGPEGLSANKICFLIDNSIHYAICHDEGICLYDIANQSWTDYPAMLPVLDACYFDGELILTIMGCGTDSDGIYMFDPGTGEFTLVEYLECPYFIAFDETINKYYIGFHLGLATSNDGVSWDYDSTFEGMNIISMDIFQNHIVLSQLDNMYGIWYSEDHGFSWTQSPLSSPMISYLRFDYDQKLYGVFPDESYSSGLWSSTDYGINWDVEFWSVDLNCVGFDFMNEIFVGWDENPSGEEEGIARYDPENGSFHFMNEGLASLVIRDIRINPAMEAPALFCCTDSGAYVSFDFAGLSDKKEPGRFSGITITPNPASGSLVINAPIIPGAGPAILRIFRTDGRMVHEQALDCRIETYRLDISRFNPGMYEVTVTQAGITGCRPLIVY